MPEPGILVLLRHGQSTLNAQGRFTGLLNPPLTARGREEALTAAQTLASCAFIPDIVFSSTMARAQQTGAIVNGILTSGRVPVQTAWELNERSYGALTGRRREDVVAEFGPRLLHQWRRSLTGAPPPMSARRLGVIGRNSAVTAMPPGTAQATESLNAVAIRMGRFWSGILRPELVAGSKVLVIGHGNSLRALCLVIDRLNEDEVEGLNLPTGHPIEYRFGSAMVPSVRAGTYLDPAASAVALSLLAAEGGT